MPGPPAPSVPAGRRPRRRRPDRPSSPQAGPCRRRRTEPERCRRASIRRPRGSRPGADTPGPQGSPPGSRMSRCSHRAGTGPRRLRRTARPWRTRPPPRVRVPRRPRSPAWRSPGRAERTTRTPPRGATPEPFRSSTRQPAPLASCAHGQARPPDTTTHPTHKNEDQLNELWRRYPSGKGSVQAPITTQSKALITIRRVGRITSGCGTRKRKAGPAPTSVRGPLLGCSCRSYQVGRSAVGTAGRRIGNYLLILVTWPAPTVRPPSRMANFRPSSMATGWISETVMRVLSPGMTISVPSGRVTTPVTSVVRK